MSDTIFAPATPPGIGAVAVIRISGPDAHDAVRALTGSSAPAARRLTRRRLGDPATGEAFDDALVAWFPGPNSFTGEDCAELHLHGSRATLALAINALSGLPGLRLARPGEFARRAFMNGKLDLSQVEAIADLIAADTAAQAHQAYRQLSGRLGMLCEAWRQRLLLLRAQAEAEIDFPDEDLEGGIGAALRPELALIRTEIAALLQDSRRGERLREGFAIAILGPPNAGKSSLLNLLAGREAAIVSAVAGTTRDVLEVALDLGGWPVVVADTAGLRALDPTTADVHTAIEVEGMRRARARAHEADLRLVVLDACNPIAPLTDAELRRLLDHDAVLVWNKIDLRDATDIAVLPPHPAGGPVALISARDGTGCTALVALLEHCAARALSTSAGDSVAITRARHREALLDAEAALARAMTLEIPELLAEELRLASEAIGRITGRSDVEAMLDVLFSTFCIGK